MIDRCSWSDLPPAMCDHCTPGVTVRIRHTVVATQSENIPATIAARPMLTYPTGRTLPEDHANWRLSDYVAALCDHTRHAEPREIELHHASGSTTTYTERHITVSPPLILQLWQAAATSRGMDGGNRVLGSSPSASLEALDLAMQIEHKVHQLLRRDHGLTNSHDDYADTINAVRHLGSLTTDPKSDNARTIRSWWAGARVVTGWDLPAFKPNNTCPLCATRGSLRIRYPTAICVECRQTWDDETIGLLGQHVRAENNEDDEPHDTPEVAEAG